MGRSSPATGRNCWGSDRDPFPDAAGVSPNAGFLIRMGLRIAGIRTHFFKKYHFTPDSGLTRKINIV